MFAAKMKAYDEKILLAAPLRGNDLPAFEDRERWEALPADVRRIHMELGERYLGQAWSVIPATSFMEFEREGKRDGYQAYYFERRKALSMMVIAECIEGNGRFLDSIIDGIWLVCEESAWWLHAHNYLSLQGGHEPLPNVEEPLIDLFAAETGMMLAWIHYLLGSELRKISPLIPNRIQVELKRRIFEPFWERDDFWWMGMVDQGMEISNWTTWCSENVLMTYLLMEEDDREVTRSIKRLAQIVDCFMDVYPADGACTEGPGYWSRAGGSLCNFCDWVKRSSGGQVDLFQEPLVQEIGRFIYRGHIDGQYVVNYSDSGFKATPAPYTVYRYGLGIGDSHLTSFASALLAAKGLDADTQIVSLYGLLRNAFDYSEMKAHPAVYPYVQDVWLPDTAYMIAREHAGSSQGFFLAAKGGHNEETHHNHNDVGNFILYYDGKPVLIDVGMQPYTKMTFSKGRYDLWNIRSSHHNVPLIGGYEQRDGSDYRALDVDYKLDVDSVSFALDIAKAYPEEAGVRSWIRDIKLFRGGDSRVELKEQFELARSVDSLSCVFMVMNEPEMISPGHVRLDQNIVMQYDCECFQLQTERIDGHQPMAGLPSCFRIMLTWMNPGKNGNWQIKFYSM
ncbi:hypothetical protein A8709_28250 [Paenibacillus pectinilyticus]|uniref:Heparinase II/III-like C-terminal domain-containing protein n=1 Tax=Paenibacillus pectinilyticus TaxID=512399 RepID=A0A1C0ZUI6_9BACL|nr:heparinase II/III family protein [Paenibacillus pectinilyticus]OCT11766.1 hypothetical protein A8709_28250 [Paenibacillus pectinilyticus]